MCLEFRCQFYSVDIRQDHHMAVIFGLGQQIALDRTSLIHHRHGDLHPCRRRAAVDVGNRGVRPESGRIFALPGRGHALEVLIFTHKNSAQQPATFESRKAWLKRSMSAARVTQDAGRRSFSRTEKH